MESKYFNINEFKCKCGGKYNDDKYTCEGIPANMPPSELITVLENIREHFNKPLIITSGYRCEKHNKASGGAPKSRHLIGDAVDFRVKEVSTKEVYKYVIEQFGARDYGIAISINPNSDYMGFIHLDTRGKRARWSYNKAGEAFLASLENGIKMA